MGTPSRVANASRNAGAERGRHRRWAAARDALWGFLGPRLEPGMRAAILGAGNADDLPLRRIAERAASVTLLDLDPHSSRLARRRLPWRQRRRVSVVGCDVTGGAADRIVGAALHGTALGTVVAPEGPLPGAPYDLAIGDLLYSQLLYPALVDLEVPDERRAEVIRRHAPTLTRAVVARLHASAPAVVHVHDPLAWWEGHEQPADLEEILWHAAAGDIEAALDAVARGLGPTESDPRAALRALGLTPRATALWRWPFVPGVDYLACATLAGTLSDGAARPRSAAAP